MAYQQMGPASGQMEYVEDVVTKVRGRFANLIGAKENEIGLVHCTKAGEQIAIDAVDDIKMGGGIVTNDLHFSGSLHNLMGLQATGRKVTVVKAENWQVPTEKMLAAIDDSTALVVLSLVSNVNGHIENMAEITQKAHRHGALVYADIIQAAGTMPLDIRALGVDMAACSTYKWLFGVFGAGFVYVRQDLQGKRLRDRLFPGRVDYNYTPWTETADPSQPDWITQANSDATRYQPGHVNYMGYCAAYEGLQFLESMGVETIWKKALGLNQRLHHGLDPEKYTCISPHMQQSAILCYMPKDRAGLRTKLEAAKITVTHIGNRIRISPAVYNTEADIDALLQVLNS